MIKILSMDMNVKTFLLKTIPYFLSVVVGIIIFLIALHKVHNLDASALLNNVAASLLSIPLVFLLYDYTNYRISRQVNKTIANNVFDKTNSVMLNIAAVLRGSLGLKGRFHLESFNKLQDWSLKKLSGRLRLRPKDMRELRVSRYELDDIIYRSTKGNVLSEKQAEILSSLSKELSHLITEAAFKPDKQLSAKHIKKIISGIIAWQEASISLVAHLESLSEQPEEVGV